MAEIFLCLTGEVMIKYIQTNAAVQIFNKSVDFCKNIFLKSYGIDLDMNNVNSVLYNILKENGFSSSMGIVFQLVFRVRYSTKPNIRLSHANPSFSKIPKSFQGRAFPISMFT